MISKVELHHYSSLLSKKHRKAENKFLVEGEKSVLEGLKSNYACEVVFLTNKFAEEHDDAFALLSKFKNKIVSLKQKEFLKIVISVRDDVMLIEIKNLEIVV